ncbi:DUF3318 domain-containing protein [Cupriavidus campinensis]
MTTPNDNPIDERPRAEHPRPVRFTREVRLPLAVRKELLITRAALERYDAAQALHQVRSGTRRLAGLTSLAAWLPRLTRSSSWLKLLGVTREYPMLSTAITLAMPLLRRTAIGRAAWKVSKVGLLAGAGYWAYKTWQSVKSPATAQATAAKAHDTGFRDPLVPSPTPASPPPQP